MAVSTWRHGRATATGMLVPGVVAVLVGLGAGPASAKDAPDGISAGDGRLLADGAAVEVPVRYTCPKGWTRYLSVQLCQPVGRERLIRGHGEQAGSCTGDVLVEQVFVPPGRNRQRFRPGTVAVRVTMSAYNPYQSPLAGGCLPAAGCGYSIPGYGPEERERHQKFGGETTLIR